MTDSIRAHARVAAAHTFIGIAHVSGEHDAHQIALGTLDAVRLHLQSTVGAKNAFDILQEQADLACESTIVTVAPR